MLAAIFDAIDKPLRIDRVPDPAAGAGDLVLRVGACGVCGSDLHAAGHEDGAFGQPLPAGTILGHEVVGEVVEIGSGVCRRWSVGDRVTGFPIFGCGGCTACRAGRIADCRSARFMGLSGAAGAYAEFARVDARHSVPVAAHVADAHAAAVEPLAVCLHAVSLVMPVRSARVLVVGAGPIGLLLAAVASQQGAARIVVSDIVAERARRALAMGADAAIDASDCEANVAACDALGGRPDIVFDAAGASGTLERCLDLAGRGARVVVVAPARQPVRIDAMAGFYKELTIRFAKAYTAGAFAEACRLIETGAIDIAPIITDVVGFDAFPAAFADLGRPNTRGKAVLAPFN